VAGGLATLNQHGMQSEPQRRGGGLTWAQQSFYKKSAQRTVENSPAVYCWEKEAQTK